MRHKHWTMPRHSWRLQSPCNSFPCSKSTCNFLTSPQMTVVAAEAMAAEAEAAASSMSDSPSLQSLLRNCRYSMNQIQMSKKKTSCFRHNLDRCRRCCSCLNWLGKLATATVEATVKLIPPEVEEEVDTQTQLCTSHHSHTRNSGNQLRGKAVELP